MVTNNSAHVRLFEQKIQDYLGSAIRPITFCNGEMALFHLIQAWKIKLGYDVHETFDVLVPSFTFVGTINAIVLNNLRPIFCDIDDTLTISPEKLSTVVTDAKMIVAVGVYGNIPDVEGLGRYASEKGMPLLFDNAPAFTSQYKKQFVCNLGYSEIYSFHATKIFNSMEGGAAVVGDDEVAGIIMNLRDFGQYEKTRGDVMHPGLNSKMQEVSALVGLNNLSKIDNILKLRSAHIKQYKDFFGICEQKGFLQNMKVAEHVFCPYLYYPIILNGDATPFVEFMNQNGIAVRRYYTAVHELKYYKNKYPAHCLQKTDEIKNNIVSLPIHTIMTEDEIKYLFNTIKSFFRE
ncbi:dTDP-4-amino-4,6-dideoxy-D-glucose transaminase [subsurface metagenome]